MPLSMYSCGLRVTVYTYVVNASGDKEVIDNHYDFMESEVKDGNTRALENKAIQLFINAPYNPRGIQPEDVRARSFRLDYLGNVIPGGEHES